MLANEHTISLYLDTIHCPIDLWCRYLSRNHKYGLFSEQIIGFFVCVCVILMTLSSFPVPRRCRLDWVQIVICHNIGKFIQM